MSEYIVSFWKRIYIFYLHFRFYEVIYMNWNPSLFKHTYAIHQTWNAGTGPAKDMIDISNNPQFSLSLAPGN